MATAGVLATLLAVASAACAATALYGVTLRNRGDAASGGVAGEIYRIDPATGKSRRLASLSLDGQPIGLRGLAVHPTTHLFYATTTGVVPNLARALVTLDPVNGHATLIGPLGAEGADLNFDRQGRLFVWLPATHALGTVDLGTGHVTAEAPSELAETVGGGFAIGPGGTAVLSATSAAGTLDMVDLATGRASVGPRLSGAPFVTAINAMDFAPDGRLFGINTNMGEPARAELVTIDARSGHVTDIGPLPDDMTALAFGPAAGEEPASSGQPRGTRMVVFISMATFIGLVTGFVAGRRLNSRR